MQEAVQTTELSACGLRLSSISIICHREALDWPCRWKRSSIYRSYKVFSVEVKDAWLMPLMLGFVTSLIFLYLRPYKSQNHGDCLERVYNQDNIARYFWLEHEIACYLQRTLP